MRKTSHYRPPAACTAPPGSLPRRFRRPRLLIVGAGDIGMRLAALLQQRYGLHWRVLATTRRADQAQRLRAAGALPLPIDLDRIGQVRRLRGLANWMIDLAPPPAAGPGDPRTRRLTAALRLAAAPRLATALRLGAADPPRGAAGARWVYISTTGVYGDCGGASFDETRPTRPGSERALRRVDAERSMRAAGRDAPVSVSILRVPGIYAEDRLPLDRLQRRTPVLRAEDDVYTNHIHGDDLARLCLASLWHGRANRTYHAVDDSDSKMGDYFDRVADAAGLPRPPRLPRAEIARQVSPAMLSFMSESRRLRNGRIKRELRFQFLFPTVADALLRLRWRPHP